jgi:hypothetical protein
MKHRHNSEGKPIHHTDEGIRNFHRWFGDSTLVDEYGRPKVVYHGVPALYNHQTDSTPLPFNEFTKTGSGLHSFSTDKNFAERYAGTKSQDAGLDLSPYVFSTYLKTKTFDPDNQDHINQIRPHLPETVPHQGKYGWAAWGNEIHVPKEQFLEKLQGINDVYRPLSKEAHENAQPGKRMTLDGGSIFVHHKTPTHVYYSPSYHIDGLLPEHFDHLRELAQSEPEKSIQTEFKFKHPDARPWDIPKTKKVGIYSTTWVPAKEKGDNWEYTENDTFKQAATKAGFNAVKQIERWKTNIAVFDKSQIKSATHNVGSFSHPTKIDESIRLNTFITHYLRESNMDTTFKKDAGTYLKQFAEFPIGRTDLDDVAEKAARNEIVSMDFYGNIVHRALLGGTEKPPVAGTTTVPMNPSKEQALKRVAEFISTFRGNNQTPYVQGGM